MILGVIHTLFLVIDISFHCVFHLHHFYESFWVCLESHSKSKRCHQLADGSRHVYLVCIASMRVLVLLESHSKSKRHCQLADDIGVIQTLLVVIHRSFCWVFGLCHFYESVLILWKVIPN